MPERTIGTRRVGPGNPTYFIGEIGINHNGSVDIAKRLIDAAVHAGCDAVKFQKRTPEICVPPAQRDIMRDTPWGYISYMEYRERVEYSYDEYSEINDYCSKLGIHWFASCWDKPSVDFIEQFEPVCYKIASASVTDIQLIRHINSFARPVMLSSGMSTMGEIELAVAQIEPSQLLLAHSTSTYPCPVDELNLRMIQTLGDKFDVPIGYSGHESGLQTTIAAVALGACFVERHITLDRTMWGSDQAASIEPHGLERLVKAIRNVEAALGDGIKVVYHSEIPARNKLRNKAS